MTVRRFVLLGRSDSELLRKRFGTAVASWQKEWCADDATTADIVLLDAQAGVPMGIQWHTGSLDAEATVSVGVAERGSAALMAALVGSAAVAPKNARPDGDIMKDVKHAALRSLAAALFDQSTISGRSRPVRWSTEEPGAQMWEGIKGFVVARCRLNDVEIYLVSYPSVTNAFLGINPATSKRRLGNLASRQSALTSQTAHVEVCAGDAELALPELATLTVGDVITLDRRLQDPALVKFGNGTVICAGYLGTQGERKAVQLTSLRESKEV